jgi:light-regulated signal transduction histidine kinase (bacteriophytochrome)
MVYKFDQDWHGEVLAESLRAERESYLGLHYPASDIPAQARELYKRNVTRMIADVAYNSVALRAASQSRHKQSSRYVRLRAAQCIANACRLSAKYGCACHSHYFS